MVVVNMVTLTDVVGEVNFVVNVAKRTGLMVVVNMVKLTDLVFVVNIVKVTDFVGEVDYDLLMDSVEWSKW